ncbi:hypothetical protein [Caproiciproducens sp. MSJ-32]|uniref:hypothetical protein n=1 Tax=Caproiciproducens sp. MSJ-32 TaxID=2841527 RepID=UPI001C0F82D6|nr:hypothetical protein [Caproiciproducens sp. MSJ-32]MBU5455893.1 hypothetical protein [Caproiciproducens sp. MSJ-32]
MNFEQEIIRLLERHKEGITLDDLENVYFKNDVEFREGKTIKVGENIHLYLEKLEEEGRITIKEDKVIFYGIY